MTRIVTTHYRYKRPPRRKKPVALAVPAIVRKNGRRRNAAAEEKKEKLPRGVTGPGQEDPTPASDDRKPAIVTVRRSPAKILPLGLLPETPEEHQRRGDAADALWRELVRRVAEKT